MYTLDTNAIIYYLKDDPTASLVLREVFAQDSPIYVSAITEIELFGFPKLTPGETIQLDRLLHTVAVISVDSRIARIAGALRRSYKLKLPDSAVAATTLFTGTVLLTRNVRDFRKVPQLRLRQI